MVVALNYSTFFQSVEYLGVSVSVAVFYVYPALTALAAWLLLREPFQFKIILALVLTVAGCVLVSGALQTKVSLSSMGIALGLVSASSYAAYITIVRKTVRTHPPERVLTFSLLFSLPWLFVATKLVHTPFFPKPTLLPWIYIFALALVPTVLGYYSWLLLLCCRSLPRQRNTSFNIGYTGTCACSIVGACCAWRTFNISSSHRGCAHHWWSTTYPMETTTTKTHSVTLSPLYTQILPLVFA